MSVTDIVYIYIHEMRYKVYPLASTLFIPGLSTSNAVKQCICYSGLAKEPTDFRKQVRSSLQRYTLYKLQRGRVKLKKPVLRSVMKLCEEYVLQYFMVGISNLTRIATRSCHIELKNSATASQNASLESIIGKCPAFSSPTNFTLLREGS